MSITKKERELMTPGPCLRCGVIVVAPYERNSAGHCVECHNLYHRERKAARKEQRKGKMFDGVMYWKNRGIVPGDRVFMYAVSMLAGLANVKVIGIAKTGLAGAYVAYDGKQYQPKGWEKL
jgi:hypothetical protein